jgi:TnpA family transposase
VSVHIVCNYLTVFFNRLGEIRDRSFEQQRYRASGLNLVTVAVVLWNSIVQMRIDRLLHGLNALARSKYP